MDAKQACESQAEYAPNPSNSTGLEMPARDCCEGLPVVVDSPDVGFVPKWARGLSESQFREFAKHDVPEAGQREMVDSPDAGDYVHPQGGTMHVKHFWCSPAYRNVEAANCKATLNSSLPTSPAKRKAIPLCTGLLDYFPKALAAVAECSRVGNDQHNPGEPLHWAREKSTDQADCIVRHLIERGTVDTDGVRHSAKVAWRALALLELEIEAGEEGSK